MKIMLRCIGIAALGLSLTLAGCVPSTPPPTEPALQSEEDQVTTPTPVEEPTPTSADEEEGVGEPLPPEPQRLEFQSGDGARLVGMYWPPAINPAPGVILMHQYGMSKESWLTFGTLLQGRAIATAHEAAQEPRSYAVFAFDFRGHGESGGDASDRAGMVGDAQAALDFFKTLPGVDAEHIVMIGTSIGADAAVDACGEGCIGAGSLSPGSYLDIPFNDGLAALGDKFVLCVATEGDVPSAQTCRDGTNVGLGNYRTHIYSGNQHGIGMFDIFDQSPALIDMLFQWLSENVPYPAG